MMDRIERFLIVLLLILWNFFYLNSNNLASKETEMFHINQIFNSEVLEISLVQFITFALLFKLDKGLQLL